MQQRLSFGTIVVVLLLFPVTAAFTAGADKANAQKDLAALRWLAGSWSGPMWGGQFEAYYSTPEGGRILSHSRLLMEKRVAFYEFEVFEIVDDALRLTPHPGGKPADPFSLSSLDGKAKKAVFDNPKKDFPTRITYQRVADDKLVITLTDPHKKSGKKEVFTLTR